MTDRLAKILEYQDIDMELNVVEKALHDNPVRKEYMANGKKLSAVSEKVASYEKKAEELINLHGSLNAKKSAIEEEIKQVQNSVDECVDEVGAKYLKEQNKKLIGELDEVSTKCEELASTINALLSEYSVYTKDVKQAKESYLKIKPVYDELVAETTKKREEINKRLADKVKEIDPSVLDKYLAKKKEQPFTKILFKCEGEFCSHCNQELSGLAKSKLADNSVIECENCHKLLYN